MNRLVAVILLLLISLASPLRAEEPAVLQERESGPLLVVMSVDRVSGFIVDPVTIEIETTIAPGYVLEEPDYEDVFIGFELESVTEGPPTTGVNGGTKRVRTIVLEPDLPGEAAIPSLRFVYRKAGERDAAGRVRTERVPVVIDTLLEDGWMDQEPDVGALRDVADPREPERAPIALLLSVALLLLVSGVGLLAWVRFKRIDPMRELTRWFEAIETRLDQATREHEGGTLSDLGAFDSADNALRDALARRDNADPHALSIDELFAGPLLTSGLSTDERVLMRQTLQACETARYAGVEESSLPARDALANARSLVRSVRDHALVSAKEGVG